MNQLQKFIKKADEDAELYKKVEALSMEEATDEEYIGLASEYGITIANEELEQARSCVSCKNCSELSEGELDDVVGGSGGNTRPITADRFDPEVCPSQTRTRYECVGFMKIVWCDHYDRQFLKGSNYGYMHQCKMGYFKYAANIDGNN